MPTCGPAQNKLTGGQALAYGRARHAVAGGDFGRSANQGLMIMAAAGFAKLVGPAKLPAILRKAAPKITTNLSAEQVLTFAAGAYVTRSEQGPQPGRDRRLRMDLGRPVDRSARRQRQASVRRHQGWQPVVIVAAMTFVS